MDPPELSLRADFSRNLPHMQPWLADRRPVPCIYDGELAELLHREGLAGILNQTAVWLERAALSTLIDPNQGGNRFAATRSVMSWLRMPNSCKGWWTGVGATASWRWSI